LSLELCRGKVACWKASDHQGFSVVARPCEHSWGVSLRPKRPTDGAGHGAGKGGERIYLKAEGKHDYRGNCRTSLIPSLPSLLSARVNSRGLCFSCRVTLY